MNKSVGDVIKDLKSIQIKNLLNNSFMAQIALGLGMIYACICHSNQMQYYYNTIVGRILIIFIISISSIAMFIYLPLLLGMFNIIFRAASPETTPSVSNESLVSFIILSTALGALILWFTGSSPTKNTSGQGNFITTKGIGKLFLFSALVLSLFLLVNPVLPSIEESTGFYETVIKAMALLSIIGGCFGFTTAILLGLFFIWKL